MSEQELSVDPRTKRLMKSTKRYDEPKPKDNARELRTRMLFNELIKSPIYPELVKLAYETCTTIETPISVDQLVFWHFNAIKRSAMDSLFKKLQEKGKEVPPEEQPIIEGMRQSLFAADNLEE